TVHGEIRQGERSAAASVRWIDKPWASESQWRRASDSDVIFAGSSLASSPEAARAEAANQAAEQLVGRVRQYLQTHRPELQKRLHRARPELIRRLAREQVREKLLQDEFIQRFERPYGDVYQCQTKVAASRSRVQRLANLARMQVEDVRRSRMQRALGVAGIAGAILVVYLFLNAATRGYYAWSLRIAGIVLAAAGAALVLLA
ncbi:MAG: hypothetical protein ACOC93_04335, partial [Planctomycetota bacterium]